MDASRIETNWQIGKGVIGCLEYMYDNNLWTDITISIKSDPEPVRLKAHSFILKGRSPVFEAMLNGSYAESSSEEINIQDVDPERFKEMIRYMYCDRVDITINNVLGLRNVAKMYMLDKLEALCSDFVSKKMFSDMNSDNVFSTFNQAVALQQEDAVKTCLWYFTVYLTANVLKSGTLLKLPHDALLRLVKHDALKGQDEHHLLAACIRWAQHQKEVLKSRKSLRNILGDILYNIRFREMTVDEFINANSDGTLLPKVPLAIVSDISKHNQETGERLSEMGFNMTYRIGTLTKADAKDWKTPVDATYTYNGTEILKIVTSKPVLMHAAGVLHPFDDTGHINGQNVKVTVSGGGETQRHFEHCFVTPASAPMQPLLVFDYKPIRLNPGVEYTIECSVPDDKSVLYYSTSGFERKGHDTSYITITTQQYPAVVERKRYHEKWNLSYLHQLGVQPLDMVDIKDHTDS